MAVENYGGELQDPSIAIASGTIGGEPSEAIGASDPVGFSSVLRQGSNWTGLNKNLIATLQPMNFTIETSSDNKKQIVYVNDLAAPVVAAPIKTDGSMEIQSTWTSAFEGEAQEAKRPLITSLIQSGQAAFGVESVSALLPQGATSKATNQTMEGLVGRTSMTRLNSTQTFTGAPPIKLSVTMIFKAFTNPISEVLTPVATLASWALPQELAYSGVLLNALSGEVNFETMLPSKIPRVVCYRYANQVLKPMVIESLSIPSSYPMDSNGNPLYIEVQMQLGSLTGKDANDIADIFGYQSNDVLGGVLGLFGGI